MRKLMIPPPKDSQGAYLKAPLESPSPPPCTPTDLSIDDEMNKGLLAIHRLMKKVNENIVSETNLKDTVLILKACMDMLKDLKKAEMDLLDPLTSDELHQILDQEVKKDAR